MKIKKNPDLNWANVNDLGAFGRGILFNQPGLFVDGRGYIRNRIGRRVVFYACARSFSNPCVVEMVGG